MKTDEVLARTYITGISGQESHELIRTPRGKYLIAEQGGIRDARDTLSADAARKWYDDAAHKIGARP